MKLRSLIYAGVAFSAVFLSSAASAQTSTSATAIGTGISSAGGGNVGDIISLPGSASVGGAYGVDCSVAWVFGQCKTLREKVMLELLDQMIGAGTTNPIEARALQLAIARELGYRIVYRDQSAGATRVSTSGGVSAPRLVQPAQATSGAMPVATFVRPAVAGGSVFNVNGQNRTINIDPATVPVGGTMRIEGVVYRIES